MNLAENGERQEYGSENSQQFSHNQFLIRETTINLPNPVPGQLIIGSTAVYPAHNCLLVGQGHGLVRGHAPGFYIGFYRIEDHCDFSIGSKGNQTVEAAIVTTHPVTGLEKDGPNICLETIRTATARIAGCRLLAAGYNAGYAKRKDKQIAFTHSPNIRKSRATRRFFRHRSE